MDNIVDTCKTIRGLTGSLMEHYGGCRRCGACCKPFAPSLYEHEIEKIANYLGLSIKQFKKLHLQKVSLKEFNTAMFVLRKPCQFYKNSRCTIYGVRPLSCKQFPFQWAIGVPVIRIEGIDLCPVATQLGEELNEWYDKNIRPIEIEEVKENTELLKKATERVESVMKEGRRQKGIAADNAGKYMMLSILDLASFADNKGVKIND
jgi:Fe-S-cluster containining protein